MGKLVNQRELLEILGYTNPTVLKYQKQGMPMVSAGKGKGSQNTYDTEQVIQWLIRRGSGAASDELDFQVERARLTKEQADKTALENEVKRGNLIPADEVTRAWSHMVTEIKARLLGLPNRLAPLVTGCGEIPQAREILDDGIRDALASLSSGNVSVVGDDESSPEADDQPVGRQRAAT